MGEPTAEEFETWRHPCDVIEHYHQVRDLNPKALVTSMLCDGLLRAGAMRLVLNGRDHGLALIPREAWPLAAKTEVWTEGRFQLMHISRDGDITISAYDVRIDPQIQDLPTVESSRRHSDVAPADASEKPPLPDALLEQWGRAFRAGNPTATEAHTRRAIEASFPNHSVSRERLRRIKPSRDPGRPLKDKG